LRFGSAAVDNIAGLLVYAADETTGASGDANRILMQSASLDCRDVMQGTTYVEGMHYCNNVVHLDDPGMNS